ncbi:thioredoxin-like [Haliotis rufescens]|uniref:thioredoxin-like n=1 Tax=Haliotis rufescens TaxID=6454 RepID=UPI001EB07B1C|nr:thioredoxin-like [Haliotis rufescens]
MNILQTKAQFDQMLAANPGKLIVVDFFATWCGPCRDIAPFLESLSDKYDQVVFCKVDVDENQDTSEECGVDCMPTFRFYINGIEVDSLEGADRERLESKIVSNL